MILCFHRITYLLTWLLQRLLTCKCICWHLYMFVTASHCQLFNDGHYAKWTSVQFSNLCFCPTLQVFPALPIKNLFTLDKFGHRLVPASKDTSQCPVLIPPLKGNFELKVLSVDILHALTLLGSSIVCNIPACLVWDVECCLLRLLLSSEIKFLCCGFRFSHKLLSCYIVEICLWSLRFFCVM